MKPYSLPSDLTAALVLGSGLSLFDLLVGASRQAFDPHPAEFLFVPLAASALGLAVAYLLFVRLASRLRSNLDPAALRLATAAAVSAPFLAAVALLPGGEGGLDTTQRNFLLVLVPLAAYSGYAGWHGLRQIGVSVERLERLIWLFWPLLAVAVLIRLGANLGEGNDLVRRILALVFALGCFVAYRAVRRASDTGPLRWSVGAAAGLLIAAGLVLPFAPSSGMQSVVAAGNDPRPNVLLITIDALRSDRLSSYGGPVSTPNIDALATDGILFEQAGSPASWTKPAMLSVLTGLSPFVHGATDTGYAPPPEIRSIATFLGEAGYTTHALGYNWHLAAERIDAVARSFDSYDVAPIEVSPRTLSVSLFDYLRPGDFHPHETTERITEASIEWIHEHSGRQFALWNHYFDPHGPYTPQGSAKSELNEEILTDIRIGATHADPETIDRLRLLYEGEIAMVDDNVGRLIDSLKESGLYDNTLIVVTSDHGDEFYEHQWVDHGHSLYEELLRVPLIVKLPAGMRSEIVRGRVQERVSTTSVLPTILDALAIPFNPDEFSRHSLRSRWQSPEPLEPQTLFARGLLYFDDRDAVLEGDRKLIVRTQWDRPELYDLSLDPGEQHNLASERPEEVTHGKALLEAHVVRSLKLRETLGLTVGDRDEAEPDERSTDLLRTLGYL